MTAAASPLYQKRSIFGCFAVAGVFWGAFVATLPALQAISGLDAGRFGLFLTLNSIGGMIAMQVLGRVLHRVQAVAIPFSLGAFALGMVMMGLVQGPVTFGLAMLVAGAASGTLDISLNMRVARIEADLRISLFNRVHALFPFSMLVTSAIVGLVREWGATPVMIFPPAALLLAVMAVVEYRAGRHQRPGPGPAKGAARVGLRGVLIVLGVLAGMGATMEGGAHTWSALFVEGEMGAGPLMGGLAAAAITLGLTTGRLIAHRLEHVMRDMMILRFSALLAVPAFVILALADSPAWALAGFFLAGAGIGPIEPAVYRSVTKRNGEATRGRALALVTGIAYVGFLASPPIMGTVIEGLGWMPMWLLLGSFAIIASALTLRIPPARE